jgi:hypothetical protein
MNRHYITPAEPVERTAARQSWTPSCPSAVRHPDFGSPLARSVQHPRSAAALSQRDHQPLLHGQRVGAETRWYVTFISSWLQASTRYREHATLLLSRSILKLSVMGRNSEHGSAVHQGIVERARSRSP